MADRGYENYNLFAHIEERLFDYVVRVRDSDNSCMVSGLNLPKTEEYDITKRVVLTRHFSGPAAINTEKYKYLSKKSRFDCTKSLARRLSLSTIFLLLLQKKIAVFVYMLYC